MYSKVLLSIDQDFVRDIDTADTRGVIVYSASKVRIYSSLPVDSEDFLSIPENNSIPVRLSDTSLSGLHTLNGRLPIWVRLTCITILCFMHINKFLYFSVRVVEDFILSSKKRESHRPSERRNTRIVVNYQYQPCHIKASNVSLLFDYTDHKNVQPHIIMWFFWDDYNKA